MTTLTPVQFSRPLAAAGSPWDAMRPCDEEGAPLFEDTYLAAARTAPTPGANGTRPGMPAEGVLEASTVGAALPGALAVPLQIVIMGGPGSGKGTQGKLLSERYGIPHISTGDLCRAEAAQDTERGRQVKALIEAGNMAPSDVVYELLHERLTEPDCEDGFVLDGFPRVFEQVPMLRALRRDLGDADFLVVGLEVDDSVSRDRLLKRGRKDDTPEVIEHRLKVYHDETQPVIEFFQSQGEYFGVDGTLAPEEISQQIQQIVDTPSQLRPH
ncbi:MAG: adenylate kinase [Candidatus Eremiobacterota bacterium]